MSTEAVWKLVRETADALEFDEAPVIELDDDPAALDELRARLAPIAAAVRLLQSKALEAMQPHLGNRGFVRFGERVYRAAPDNKWKLRDETKAEFWDWVKAENAAQRLFNPNAARITGLREVGDHWCNRETGEVGWSAFEDYFLDVEVGEVSVSEMPANKAPKFIQNAPDRIVEKRD
jgi:hypothetical protein